MKMDLNDLDIQIGSFMDLGLRRCKTCKTHKLVSQFYDRKDRKNYRCKDCQNKLNKRRRKRGKGDLTHWEWLQIKAQWGHVCAYCGSDGPLTKDRVIPGRSGGTYTKANIVPACAACNRNKAGKRVDRWMKRRGFDYDQFERRRLVV